MVHANHWNPAREGERLRIADTHEQRTDQPRRSRHSDCIDIIERRARILQRALYDRHDAREMRARRDFRNYAAKNLVHVLRKNHKRLELGRA